MGVVILGGLMPKTNVGQRRYPRRRIVDSLRWREPPERYVTIFDVTRTGSRLAAYSNRFQAKDVVIGLDGEPIDDE